MKISDDVIIRTVVGTMLFAVMVLFSFCFLSLFIQMFGLFWGTATFILMPLVLLAGGYFFGLLLERYGPK